MSNLTFVEKRKLEQVLGMSSGYVLVNVASGTVTDKLSKGSVAEVVLRLCKWIEGIGYARLGKKKRIQS